MYVGIHKNDRKERAIKFGQDYRAGLWITVQSSNM